MDRDVCDRFPVEMTHLPDDEEPEVEEPCEGCESMQTDVRDGLCPECRRKDELTQMALEEAPYAVRVQLRREMWGRMTRAPWD